MITDINLNINWTTNKFHVRDYMQIVPYGSKHCKFLFALPKTFRILFRIFYIKGTVAFTQNCLLCAIHRLPSTRPSVIGIFVRVAQEIKPHRRRLILLLSRQDGRHETVGRELYKCGRCFSP